MLGFLDDIESEDALRDAIACLPKGSRAYLVGGTMRNAVYFKEHGERLRQRDFDIAYVSSDFLAFKKALLANGFTSGTYIRPDQFVVVRARKLPHALDDYPNIVLDISKAPANFQRTMKKTDFTIGGCSMPLRKILNDNWYRWIRTLPTSLADIRHKQLRLHRVGSRSLFRAIRFIYMGFSAPTKKDLSLILDVFKDIDPGVLERNIVKLQRLVPEKSIKRIARQLGVKKEILGILC